jgi:potassium-transporting ATPase KdpC subunit
MIRHLRSNLLLLVFTVVLCSVIYPGVLLLIGQLVFPQRANGSIVLDKDGKALGSSLIAQPFTKDEYFQPRPSAASYNGAASGASNWGGNNYKLRDRVARQLGPIVRYRSGPKKGQLVGPDIESWFQADRAQGQPGIVAQWAQAHSGLASAWVGADKLNTEYVAAWQKTHPAEVLEWIKDNPGTPDPAPADLAVPFFTGFSREHPGTFPGTEERKTAIKPLKEGSDIQSTFFDLWLQDHAQADLEPIPSDLVMASGSGLDPNITLKGAQYQLDRVAGAWAEKTKKDPAQVGKEIAALLEERAEAPLGGLVGVKLINVLEVNMALRDRYLR